jgi:hypothetical protein
LLAKFLLKKTRAEEIYAFSLCGKLLNLERELSSLKKLSQELEVHNKTRKEMVDIAKEGKKHVDDAYKGLEVEHAKLQKSHSGDLKIIEELRGTIERDANQISDLKTKNTEAMKQNADLAKANCEKDLRILSLKKDLADNLKVMKDGEKKIKNNFEFLFGKYSEALGEYGARPSPFPYAEDQEAIIGWLVEEFESLPELIGSASDFAAAFYSESLLKLLEIKDCADLGRFCSSGLEFPSTSSVSMIRANEYVKNIK